MTRRLLTASAAAALVLGLAACGDDTGGTITDPPSTIATGASDDGGASDGGGTGASDGGGSTEAASDIPAPDPTDYPGMDEHTDEGAKQAFKYYSDSILWGFQTGHTEELSKYAEKTCSVCTEIIDDIESFDRTGGYWSKFDSSVVRLDVEEATEYEYKVDYALSIGPHTEPDAESGGTKNVSSSAYGFSGGMTWQESSWKVRDIAVQGEDG